MLSRKYKLRCEREALALHEWAGPPDSDGASGVSRAPAALKQEGAGRWETKVSEVGAKRDWGPRTVRQGLRRGVKRSLKAARKNPINVNDQEDVDIAGKESSGQPMTRARSTVTTPVAQPRTWADPDTHEHTPGRVSTAVKVENVSHSVTVAGTSGWASGVTKKCKFGHYFITYPVINSKWIIALNIKMWSHICIRRNQGRIISNLEVEKA